MFVEPAPNWPAVSPDSALSAAVQLAGGQSAFARICGCTPANIWQLLKKGRRLPAEYVLAAEAALGVPRHVLRPDIYPPHLGPGPTAMDSPTAKA